MKLMSKDIKIKNIFNYISHNMNRRQKTEAVIASVLTLLLFAGLPAYAWFAKSKNLKTITKIKEPGEIIIRSGKSVQTNADADPVVNFEMKDIDIETIAAGTPGRYVFSVKPGEYNPQYDLILAHTTNIPFTYTLYKASYVDTATVNAMTTAQKKANLALYTPQDDETIKVYYQKIGDSLTMTNLNLDNSTTYGRPVAASSGDHYNKTYDNTDTPEIYAIPVYSKTSVPISHSEESTDTYDYYILELAWDSTATTSNNFLYSEWNKADNNKETDMIYITANNAIGQ